MKLLKKNKITLALLILLGISLLVYRQWISLSVFAYGDWSFAFSENLKEYIFPSIWGIHGGPLVWQYFFVLIFGVLGKLGLDFNVVEKITIFWPIIFILPISSYLLVREITKSNIAAFIGALILTFNTYFLSIDTQGHELLTVAFTFAPLALFFFISLLETKKKIYIPLTLIFSFIVGIWDLRSFYVLAGLLTVYFVFHEVFIESDREGFKKSVVLFLFILFILLLLNAFWIIPSALTGSLTSNEYLSRAIFGSQFYDLQSSLAFFYPYWTGKEPTWLYVQKIPMYFWLYPVLAFSGFIISRKNKKVLFFGLLALLGIFFSKQEAAPFGFVYTALFNYVPGFSAFREASKFDCL